MREVAQKARSASIQMRRPCANSRLVRFGGGGVTRCAGASIPYRPMLQFPKRIIMATVGGAFDESP
jgi:hypothetical protein